MPRDHRPTDAARGYVEGRRLYDALVTLMDELDSANTLDDVDVEQVRGKLPDPRGQSEGRRHETAPPWERRGMTKEEWRAAERERQ